MTMPGKGPLDWRRGFDGVILALMQMWEPDEMPCVPKTFWGSLDQDDTRCLSQGIPDLEEPRCGATGVHGCSDFDDVFVCQLVWLTVHPVGCDGKSFAFYPSVN